MSCLNFEMQIVAWVEGELPTRDRAVVEEHLRGCSECRAFAAEIASWDQRLSREITMPRLSEAFDARLQAAIKQFPLPSPVAIAERKRELQRDYEEGLRRLDTVWRAPSRICEVVGIFVAVGLLLQLLWAMVGELLNTMDLFSGTTALSPLVGLVTLAVAGWVSAQLLAFTTRRFQQGPVLP